MTETELTTLARIEQSAASQILDMPTDPIGWGNVLALAQVELGKITRLPSHEVIELLQDDRGMQLVATARMLDSAVQAIDDGYGAKETALLAAAAFALKGNFPSATAIARRVLEADVDLDPIEWACLATFSLRHMDRAMQFVEDESLAQQYLELLNARMVEIDAASDDEVRSSLVALFSTAELGFPTLILGLARIALELVLQLSVATVLSRERVELPNGYVELLLRSSVRALLPPQLTAISRDGLLEGSGNALIVLPTSTGKTLLGELAMFASLARDDGIACFVAPYVALAGQVYEAINDRLPAEFHLHALVGGYGLTERLDLGEGKHLIVTTPERFDSLIRMHPEYLGLLRCVVIDEVHSISSSGRGLRLEGLITRLRMCQTVGRQFRLMFLSAVVGDPSALISWLGRDVLLITSSWRPTAKRSFYWSTNGSLEWKLGDDLVHRDGQVPSSTISSRRLPWPQPGLTPPRNYGQLRSQLPKLYENVAFLVDLILSEGRGPVLCICATKAATRNLAMKIAGRLAVPSVLPQTVEALIDAIYSRHPYLGPLASSLKTQVAYHNAGLPSDLKKGIEREAREGNLRVVVATTTLAEGIDLPFRSTVVVDWLIWNGDEQGVIDPLLFKNLVGRSGRAGYHTEGDTYVIDNPLGGVELTNIHVRRNLQQGVFFPDGPPTLESSVKHEETLTRPECAAVIGSQFFAAISENPECDDLVNQFIENTYSYQSDGIDSGLELILQNTRDYLLSSDSGPLATASSPMQLTELGRAGNATGLAPQSVSTVLDALRALSSAGSMGSGALVSELLRRTIELPEMTDGRLLKTYQSTSSRFPVKPSDIATIIESWIQGSDPDEMFMDLPYVIRSGRSDSILRWRNGDLPNSTWNEEFDKFVGFIDGTVTSFLPWVLRSCEKLSPLAGVDNEIHWSLVADMVETGTNSAWAVEAVRSGLDVRRRLLCAVDLVSVCSALGLGIVFAWEAFAAVPRERLTDAITGHLQSTAPAVSELSVDIAKLVDWIKRTEIFAA